MTPPVSGLDHLLLLVKDLGAAAATMRRLGFTVSPRGLHSAHLGSANHTVMFGHNYIELWGVVTPTEFNAVHRANLAKGEGVHTVALTALDIDGVAAALAEAGIRTDPPVSFSRPVELPNGAGEARFTIMRPDRTQLPAGFMFFCRHHTPELVWVPEWMEHENKATGIEAVLIAAADPAAAAGVYAHFFPAPEPTSQPGGGIGIETGKGRLEFWPPEAIERAYGAFGVAAAASPHYKVVRIGVADLATAASVLAGNGVPFEREAARLLIPPTAAHGVLLELAGSR